MLLLGLAASAMGNTYYVDLASGSDANNGTSTSTPWKHAPGMGSGSMSYSASASDSFIFKGGVTWDKTCFPMWVPGTSAGHLMYYGVDKTWYLGASWTRPVFDAQGSALGSGGLNRMVSYNSGGGYPGNIQYDNIEFAGYYWDSSSQDYGSSIINMQQATNFIVSNCLFDKWSHNTSANGTHDTYCILGDTAGMYPGTVATNCVFDGSGGDGRSMMAAYCIWKVSHCVITNLSNGALPSGYPGEVDHCWIGPINGSFDPNDHENSIETEGPAGTYYIHHNIIDGAIAVCISAGDVGNLYYIYDNLIINSIPYPIEIDSSIATNKSATAYVWNNTIIGSSGQCISCGRGYNTLYAQNNQFIAGGVDSSKCVSATIDHNYSDSTLAAAESEGYTYANWFQPVSGSSPTVGAGVDVSSSGVPDITKDLNGLTRSGSWDIGAYQFSTNSLPSYSLTVVNGSGGGTYTSNSVVNITANLIGGETFNNWSVVPPAFAALVNNTNALTTTVAMNTNLTLTANYVTNPPLPLPGTGVVIPAGNATITSPFVLANGCISQPVETTDPAAGGEAIFTFTVTKGDNYVVQALVNAPSAANNSFFVNIDAEPVSPTMIWDTPITTNFAPVTVSWRGNGTDTSDQFVPKVFAIATGTHQLIIRGREMNVQLQNVAILPSPPDNMHAVVSASR